MKSLTLKQIIVILLHGLVGWALCGSIIGIGREVTSMQTTLILHAIGAPIIFAALSWLYFNRFNYTTPLQTAAFFLVFIMAMDFFVVATLFEKSYAMFADVLGTWIPFVLIFASTYLTGTYINNKRSQQTTTV